MSVTGSTFVDVCLGHNETKTLQRHFSDRNAHFLSFSGANVCLFLGTRILPGSLFKRSVPPEGVGP